MSTIKTDNEDLVLEVDGAHDLVFKRNGVETGRFGVDGLSVFALFVGAITPSPATVVPNGYLECDGSELSRTTYSNLFAVISTTYGPGNGSTTFNIPDLRGEFVRGWDNGKGTDSGRTIGSSQVDEFESHNHTTYSSGASANNGTSFLSHGSTQNYSNNFPSSYVGGTETRPRNIAMMYCIKY